MKMKERMEILRLKMKLRKYDIELVTVSKEEIEYFRENVRGHRKQDDITIRKYITRNWLLTESNQKIEFREDELVAIRTYGNLLMTMNLHTGVITNIENREGYFKLNINETKKAELNKILGLK